MARFTYRLLTPEENPSHWPEATEVTFQGHVVPGFIWHHRIGGRRAINRLLAKNPLNPNDPPRKSSWMLDTALDERPTRAQAAQALYVAQKEARHG